MTGGNSGLGLETCRALAVGGADVVLCSRSLEAGRAAAEQLQPHAKVWLDDRQVRTRSLRGLATPAPLCTLATQPSNDTAPPLPSHPVQGRISVSQLDLADVRSIRDLAAQLAASLPSLDLLILNGGVMAMRPGPQRTADGFEMQASAHQEVEKGGSGIHCCCLLPGQAMQGCLHGPCRDGCMSASLPTHRCLPICRPACLQFGVNHLGHFLLCQLLLPKMEAQACREGNNAHGNETLVWQGLGQPCSLCSKGHIAAACMARVPQATPITPGNFSARPTGHPRPHRGGLLQHPRAGQDRPGRPELRIAALPALGQVRQRAGMAGGRRAVRLPCSRLLMRVAAVWEAA